MSVVKVIELLGSSKKSWEDAANQAVKRASKTIKGIRAVDILGFKAKVNAKGTIVEYRTHLKVAFEVK